MSEPKGFTCKCGEEHVFGVWVAAHWDMELLHTCPKCGRQSKVCQGTVTPIRRINGHAAKGSSSIERSRSRVRSKSG